MLREGGLGGTDERHRPGQQGKRHSGLHQSGNRNWTLHIPTPSAGKSYLFSAGKRPKCLKSINDYFFKGLGKYWTQDDLVLEPSDGGFATKVGLITLLEVEFLHLVAQGVPGDAQQSGGLGLVACGLLKRPHHQVPLVLFERDALVGNLKGP